jgi:hypothetical protein
MHTGRFLCSEPIAHPPHKEFRKCVTRYGGDHHHGSFSCWDWYLAMAFAQLTYRESPRDIEACLRAVTDKLYHLGFRGKVARTTLADDPLGVALDQNLITRGPEYCASNLAPQ